jgi:hypothetical protein
MFTRRTTIIISAILLIVFLAACAFLPAGGAKNTAAAPTQPASPTGSGNCANAYFPVTTGTSWSFASSGGNRGSYTYTRTITAASDNGFTTNDQYSTGVNATYKWNCQNGNLAALDAGAQSFDMTTLHGKLTSNSIVSEGYNIPATFDSGKTWNEKVTILGTMVYNNTKSVATQIVNQTSCTTGSADSVSVPAGKFDAITANCSKNLIVSATVLGKSVQLAANHENITLWYAKGVGIVKSAATGGANNETVVLTQYKVQ